MSRGSWREQRSVRDAGRPNGKWHLAPPLASHTLCGRRVGRDADEAWRRDLDPADLCTNCWRAAA